MRHQDRIESKVALKEEIFLSEDIREWELDQKWGLIENAHLSGRYDSMSLEDFRRLLDDYQYMTLEEVRQELEN